MPDPALATDVLIAGGGPVGLTLAIELGQRGVDCTLVERNEAPAFLPKMELCNARTMEIYGRLGLAASIREAGYPAETPMDVFVAESLNSPVIAHLPYPSSAEAQAIIRAHNDGAHPREAYQRISQYTLEPLLERVAERTPGVTVRFGCNLVGVAQDAGGVRAEVEAGRPRQTMRARYLVGCDGGSSTVRKALDIPLEGQAALGSVFQVFFRSDDLHLRHPLGPARHYHLAGKDGAALVTQDDLRHYALHARVPEGTDPRAVIDRVVGRPVHAEVFRAGSWTPHLLVAERYGRGRVFLAGDSAHQYIPTGGFGLNTGIGDASNLAWKLAAAVHGWAGPRLLDSYEAERRPVGLRNCRASAAAAAGGAAWRRAWDEGVRGADLAAIIDVEQRKSHEMTGVERGYRYESAVVLPEDGEPPADGPTYEPAAWPGVRLPHLWLPDGTAVHDRMGAGFTILNVGGESDVAGPLAAALSRLGAPVEILDLPSAPFRDVYGANLLLIRPDLHVAWRGDAAPADPATVACTVTGHRRAQAR